MEGGGGHFDGEVDCVTFRQSCPFPVSCGRAGDDTSG